MQEIFIAMLSLQSRLNAQTIGPDWVKSDEQDWFLAISQECAEGIDHLAWKWWAKQKVDLEAAKMEVIDILHFCLSAEMWTAPEQATMTDIAGVLTTSYQNRLGVVRIDGITFDVTDEKPVELFRLISALATVGRPDTGLVFLLGEKLGMSAEQTMTLYRMKATLNLFRQRHGYKLGTYVKHWAPSTEDNVFLPVLAEGIDWSLQDAQDELYERLTRKYAEVQDTIKLMH